MVRYQGVEMQKRLKFHTRRLYNDRKVNVNAPGDLSGIFEFTFPIYERFLDMELRRRPLPGPKAYTKDGRLRIRQPLEEKREGYTMHNRFIYYRYNRIASLLMYGFTDEVANQIKKDFESILDKSLER